MGEALPDLYAAARASAGRRAYPVQVSVYPSEFGKAKMAEEQAHGPRGVFRAPEEADGEYYEAEDEPEEARQLPPPPPPLPADDRNPRSPAARRAGLCASHHIGRSSRMD